jgi:hypothetical protein
MAPQKTNDNKARKTLEIRARQKRPSANQERGRDCTSEAKCEKPRQSPARNDSPDQTATRTTKNAKSAEDSTDGPTPVTPARPAQSVHEFCWPTEISLFAYLDTFRIAPPSASSTVRFSQNTRSAEYSNKDITYPVKEWSSFSREDCMQRFAQRLRETNVTKPPVLITPQQNHPAQVVSSELAVVAYLNRGLSVLLNRALEESKFSIRDIPGAEAGRADLQADRIGVSNGQVRIVGDIKVSWKWKSSWRSEPELSPENKEYRQVLSQLHWYMNTAQCRWGYVLTDMEFVALERGPTFGDLKVSQAVNWGHKGERWGIGLAAWYLHAMANGDGWSVPRAGRVPRGLAERKKSKLLVQEDEVQERRRSPRLKALEESENKQR